VLNSFEEDEDIFVVVARVEKRDDGFNTVDCDKWSDEWSVSLSCGVALCSSVQSPPLLFALPHLYFH